MEEEGEIASNTRLCITALGGFILISFGVYIASMVISEKSPPLSKAELIPSSTSRIVTASTTEYTQPPVRILFVGDMFFDRQIRMVGELYGSDYPFSCIDPLLTSADFVVGNLEGPITTNKSISLGTIPGTPNNYRFTFPTTTAEVLLRHNIQVVSIGNNHIFNFGTAGLEQTHTYLSEATVGFFGGVMGNEPVDRVSIHGVQVSFIGYNEFGGSSPLEVAQKIASEKAVGRVVIVFSHWGTEYSTDATLIRPIAQLFAKSGASAIIGAHPHVIGMHEQIASTTVYYSLGNFIFDQYFSEEVRHGLAVMLTLDSNGVIQSQEFKTELERDGRTCLVE